MKLERGDSVEDCGILVSIAASLSSGLIASSEVLLTEQLPLAQHIPSIASLTRGLSLFC
jgi:hypothetical protein